MITNEQFQEWKANPTTIEIFEILEKTKQALQNGLANGQTLCTTADETHGSTARMVGNIEGLNQILDIEYKEEPTTKENDL